MWKFRGSPTQRVCRLNQMKRNVYTNKSMMLKMFFTDLLDEQSAFDGLYQCRTQSIFGDTIYSCYCKLRLVTQLPLIWNIFYWFCGKSGNDTYCRGWGSHVISVIGFELAVHNSQFAKHFDSVRMSFCVFSTNCELLKSDASWIFRIIHWTSYMIS